MNVGTWFDHAGRWLSTGRVVLWAGCALLTSGCTLQTTLATPTNPRAMALPHLTKQCLGARASRLEITLLEGGSGPRQPLRFTPRAGIEAQIAVLVPPFREPQYLLETKWLNRGRAAQSCHEVLIRPRSAELATDALPVGVLGVGSHGATSLATDSLDKRSFEVERALFWLLDQADPLLPREPVGVGARWRVKNEGSRGGEYLKIDATYRLLEVDGSRLKLQVQRHVFRPAQNVAGAQGFARRVAELRTSRTGIVDVDLRKRPFASARFFDDGGREVVRILTRYR